MLVPESRAAEVARASTCLLEKGFLSSSSLASTTTGGGDDFPNAAPFFHVEAEGEQVVGGDIEPAVVEEGGTDAAGASPHHLSAWRFPPLRDGVCWLKNQLI
ncbi:hypothetical protein B296_00035095, partial [Ensete ventricosum]